MLKSLLAGSLLFSLNLIGQDIYPLHPSVGDTIEKVEKLDYSLFPEIENSDFINATVQYLEDKFVLVYYATDKTTELTIETTMDLEQVQIIEEQKKIEKINAYYRLMAEEAKNKKETPTIPKNQKSLPIRLEGKMSEQMRKEARMNVRLMEDAQRQRDFEMGLRPREVRFEFK